MASTTISGKLVVRIHNASFSSPRGLSGSATGTCYDEITCEVEYDNQKALCSSTHGEILKKDEFGESGNDAVLDVSEFHGGTPVILTIYAQRASPSPLAAKRDRLFRVVLKAARPFKRKSQKQLTSVTLPLRDAIPVAQRRLARVTADSFESGSKISLAANTSNQMQSYFGTSSTVASWHDYWPMVTMKVPGTGLITVGWLFVPLVSPDRALQGFTELHKAAFVGDAKLVSVLLGRKASHSVLARTRDQLALTPLDVAAMRGHLEAALEIISDSAMTFPSSLSSSNPPNTKTSLHHAVSGGNSTLVGCLADHFGGSNVSSSLVLTKRDDSSSTSAPDQIPLIDAMDQEGLTALMMACERKDMAEGVRRLVEAGANLEIINKQGDTALIIACRLGNIECAMAILEAAQTVPNPSQPPESKASLARPNKANHAGDRALDRACGSCACPALIRALLDAFAVPALRRFDGSTALHVAAHAGHRENCEELIKWLDTERARMASSNGSLSEFVGSAIGQSLHLLLIRDVHGKFASDYANQTGHSQLAEWLKQMEQRDANLFISSREEFSEEEYYMNASTRSVSKGEEEKRRSLSVNST